MSAYFLGVDGGQSSTRALIGDETGRLIGNGIGGPCNDALVAIRASVGGACLEAGLEMETVRFAGACLGFSGGPAHKEPIVRELLRSDHLTVTDDAFVALAGATAGEPGIVVIAGTGSIALGRDSQSRLARAGGWGSLFGDEGGAFWIAREALRAALRWEEGWGVPTSLRARLLDATGTRNVNDLLHRCYTPEFPRPRVARFAVLVDLAADAGDPTALEILDAAARQLALIAIAVRGQLFPTDPTLVAYTGGVFASRLLLGRFRNWMAAETGVLVTPPTYDAVTGALIEAYRSAGVRLNSNQPFYQVLP
jgi:N-acetylglucosamine kinase-like BadF-type ATPase